MIKDADTEFIHLLLLSVGYTYSNKAVTKMANSLSRDEWAKINRLLDKLDGIVMNIEEILLSPSERR